VDLVTSAVEGFLLGVSMGAYCITLCAPMLCPHIVAKCSGIKQGFKASLLFSFGRLVAYLLFGSLFGIVGLAFIQQSSIYSIVNIMSLFFIGILLLIYGSVISFGEGFARKIPFHSSRILAGIRSSFILGFVIGIIPCFPLIAVLVRAFTEASLLFYMVLFATFWVGTSINLIIVGTLFGKIGESLKRRVERERLQRVCGFSMIVVGFLFLAEGFMAVIG
jgi:sulfite exporter TauE/SafE